MRRRLKYKSNKVVLGELTFDSTAEMERYLALKVEEHKGKIRDLELQKEFEIIPKLVHEECIQLKTKVKIVEKVDERAANYTCDFFYFDVKKGVWIVEEVKSKMTAKLADYILRRKLVKRLIKEHNEKCLEGEQMEFLEIIHNAKKKKKKK